jgi:hypothetical protein
VRVVVEVVPGSSRAGSRDGLRETTGGTGLNHRGLHQLLCTAVAKNRFCNALLGRPVQARPFEGLAALVYPWLFVLGIEQSVTGSGERAKLLPAPVPVRAGPAVAHWRRVRVTKSW